MMHLVRESAAAAREASLSNSSHTYTFTSMREHEVNAGRKRGVGEKRNARQREGETE